MACLILIYICICIKNAILWDVGAVNLHLDPAPIEPDPPLYMKPLLHESDMTLTALPEILHVMRPQESRPSRAVSNTATLLVLVRSDRISMIYL